MNSLDDLFARLWNDFRQLNPQADAIHRLLSERGESIVNDHVAFRTFDDPRVGIEVLARPFLQGGYEPRGEYVFPGKHLTARHYEHPQPTRPKVFLSELRLGEMSTDLRREVSTLLDRIPADRLNDPELCAAGRLWTVDHAAYRRLAAESEYAGWLAAYGFRANHFTVFVNALRTIGSLEELNALLKAQGFPLNAEGGEIKGSSSEFLEQSSTLAPDVQVSFSDGIHPVPGCYYEFARRYPLPDGTLFHGFVAKSADKIFQSTDRRRG